MTKFTSVSKKVLALIMAMLMLCSGPAVSASADDATAETTVPTFTKYTLTADNCYVDVDNIEIVVENATVEVDGVAYDVVFTATQSDDETKTLRGLTDEANDLTVFTNPETGKTYNIAGTITVDETPYEATNVFAVEVLQSQAAPATPVPLKVTSNSISVKAVANCEYKLDDGEWVDTATFTTGVTPGKQHTVYMRFKYVAGKYYASEASSVTVTALLAPKSAPEVPTLKTKTNSSIVINTVDGIEYSIDKGATWKKDGNFTNLTANTRYEIIARYTYDSSVQDASTASEALAVVTNSKKNTIAAKENCTFTVTSEGNIYANRSFSFKVTGDAPKDYGALQYGDTRLVPVSYTARLNGSLLGEENAKLSADDSNKDTVKTGIITPTAKGTVTIDVTYATEYWDGDSWENADDDKVVVYSVESGTEYNAVREFFVGLANFFLNTLPRIILKLMGGSAE